MKYLIILPLLIFFTFYQTDDVRMVGKYKMVYDYSYGSQNGVINFDGDTYARKQMNGKKVNGNVDYQKYFIILNDKNSNLQVKFSKREFGKDTIFFRTIDLDDKAVNNDPLILYGGKLIKIK